MGVLHGLALALARGEEHAMAEDKLLEAIRQLRELDGVDPGDENCSHKVKNGWFGCGFVLLWLNTRTISPAKYTVKPSFSPVWALFTWQDLGVQDSCHSCCSTAVVSDGWVRPEALTLA